MRTMNYQYEKINTLSKSIPAANEILRTRRINATTRLSLANAAAATSNNPDELLAIMEYQARRSVTA